MLKAMGSPRPLLPALLTLALVVGLCRGSVSRCPDGQFRQPHSARCQACSTCPVNQIIRRPCRQDSNTLCGPFSEFHEFHQAPRPSLEVGDLPLPGDEEGVGMGVGVADTRGTSDNRSKKVSDRGDVVREGGQLAKQQRGNGPKGQQGQQQKGDKAPPRTSAHLGRAGRTGVGERTPPGKSLPEAPSLQDPGDGQQWKVLSLALIVVLCVVCIFLIVFVFVICYMRSRRAHLKQVLYSGDKGAGPRTPAGHRPCQAMHYVPVLTHAQAARAATSAGGGAVAATPGGLVDSSYLYSEEYDADNSGQTISTTKSSDYVYFKSPHNGNHVYDV
ncbi:uncharacterized protein LOC143286846 [Babylonia areolata]|uniref:uncharacterized protein LOC143286846 n=1 Tax=Babylonia areolata TaxID=304850 RepID=UPI003FD03460